MSTITKEFTKEQLIEQARKNIEVLRGAVERIPGASDAAVIHLKLAEITLASLEAEPVCYLTWHQGFRAPDDCEEYVVEAKPGDKSCDGSPAFPVYAAPPAPVVPDMKELVAILDWILMLPCQTPKATLMAKRLAVVIDACRAAMLQGTENAESRCTIQTAPALDSSPKNAESRCSNSPVIAEGWVACSERMPEETGDIIVVSDGIVMSGVSYSRKKGFYLQALEYDADEPVDDVTHWMPLPAAPQQEVK
jgi:hypothetical protein